MNKILFGGAFDPIHLGHINMAEEASRKLDADVIFIPAPISVWKEKSVPIENKVDMLKLAIKDYPKFSIDLFEVESGKETNYSIDTAEYFVKKYPNDKIFYLIGADHVNAFHKWKEAKKLSEIVQICFFKRPNIQLSDENIRNFNMLQIDGDLMDISSTEIRELKNLKLDDSVIKYIEDHNLYYMEKISSHITGKRLSHSISVAHVAYEIAKKNNLENPEKYYIAGLLHDIGKENLRKREIMEKHFPEFCDLEEFAYHQFIGSFIAKSDFGISDEEILDAIKFHATGNSNMSLLARVVYASDKIEPTRPYDSSDLIQAMMDDVEEGFITVLKANVEFLEIKNKSFKNRLTSNCIDYYLK